jgi:hypothetical protein
MRIKQILGKERCYLMKNGDKVPFTDIDKYNKEQRAKAVKATIIEEVNNKRRKRKK